MSISYDRRNKAWRFWFRRTIKGRRYRLSKLLPSHWSETEAHEFDRQETDRLGDLASGVRRRDPLIDEAVVMYLNDKRELKSFKATAEHLASIAWAYTGKPITELAEVARTVSAQKDWTPATIRNRLACLKAACRWAWKRHTLTPHDPTSQMQLPAVRNERQVYASRDEMLGLCSVIEARDVRRMIRVAFYTALRLGELLRVEVRGDVLYLRDTKNGDTRAIPVHPRVRCCLKYLPLDGKKRYFQHAFKKARDLIGMSEIHIHDLRHSAASEMVNAGVDLYTVGKVLGHRDSRSTERYSHLTANTLAAAVGKIGQRQKSAHKPAAAGEKKTA